MSFPVGPGKVTFVAPLTNEMLAFGTVETYIPGTTNPKSTYSDEGQTSLNTNPIDLDGSGQCIIWATGTVRLIVRHQNGDLLYDVVAGYNDPGGGGGTVTFATPSEVAEGDVTDKAISPYALWASNVLIRQYPNLQLDFGGNPNGNPANPASGADNATAFSNSVASPYSRIWLSDGFFRTTGLIGSLQKYFDGPGRELRVRVLRRSRVHRMDHRPVARLDHPPERLQQRPLPAVPVIDAHRKLRAHLSLLVPRP